MPINFVTNFPVWAPQKKIKRMVLEELVRFSLFCHFLAFLPRKKKRPKKTSELMPDKLAAAKQSFMFSYLSHCCHLAKTQRPVHANLPRAQSQTRFINRFIILKSVGLHYCKMYVKELSQEWFLWGTLKQNFKPSDIATWAWPQCNNDIILLRRCTKGFVDQKALLIFFLSPNRQKKKFLCVLYLYVDALKKYALSRSERYLAFSVQ